ncbi:MAG: hypothetical protein ACFFD4_37350 [Candidatus Odinarchaeota archaeon]
MDVPCQELFEPVRTGQAFTTFFHGNTGRFSFLALLVATGTVILSKALEHGFYSGW